MKAKAQFFFPFLILLLFFSACEEDDLRSISYEDSTVQYHRSITRMEANKLGRYLKDNGYFQKGNTQEVIVSKEEYAYEILWEVSADFVPTPGNLADFYDLRDSLNRQVYTENDLDMELFSSQSRYERWFVGKALPAYIETEKHVIYYKESVEPEVAEKIAEILDAQDFFNPDGEVFMLEKDASTLFLGLASINRKSNEFKTRFSELRSNMLTDFIESDVRLIFEIRGPMLDRIDESISGPFYPNSTSANGIRIKYDESVTNDEVRALRDHIRNKRIQNPEWIVFIRTDKTGPARYKLIMPVYELTGNSIEETNARTFARSLGNRLQWSFIDLELLNENNGETKLIKAENL